MPQFTFLHEGAAVDYTPASAVTAGDVVVQGDLVGVARGDIEANRLGALAIEGVGDLAKAASAGVTFAIGAPVYWDDTNNVAVMTNGDGAHKRAGTCVEKASADADATVRVKLGLGDPTLQELLYSAVAASAAVSNTTTQTAFDKSVSIPANTLKAGDVIRVRAQAIATATNSTDTLAVTGRIGTTDVVATPAVDVANNDIAILEFDIVIRTIGASGTFVAAGLAALGVPGTATARAVSKPSTAIDTTVAQSINVTATWSVANAGNSCRLDVLDVQILSKG